MSKNAKPMPSERQLIQLAIAAIRHARGQLQDAEHLIERERWSPALVTAALGLEEMGKAHLCTSMLAYSPEQRATQATEFWKTFNSHAAKAAIAQTQLMMLTSPAPPNAATLFADITASAEKVNDAKFRGLYVDVAEDGELTEPDEVAEAHARAVVEQLARVLTGGLSLENADPDEVTEFLAWWRENGDPGVVAAVAETDTDAARMLLEMRAMAQDEGPVPDWIHASFPTMLRDEGASAE